MLPYIKATEVDAFPFDRLPLNIGQVMIYTFVIIYAFFRREKKKKPLSNFRIIFLKPESQGAWASISILKEDWFTLGLYVGVLCLHGCLCLTFAECPLKARRSHVPWNWSYRQLGAAMSWEWDLGPVEEQPVPLTTEPPLQFLSIALTCPVTCLPQFHVFHGCISQ